jgi:hypothetical protein
MINIKKYFLKKIFYESFGSKPWDDVIIFVMNILIAIPLFIIAHQNLIELNWIFNLDRILLFLLMIVVIQLILRLTDHYHYMYIYIHPGFFFTDSF